MINFDKEVNKCVEVLKNGGIILYPTDTIYGIGCDSYNLKAMENVNKLKGSNPSKPLIHLMNSLKMVEIYLKQIPEIAKKSLTGKNPTTVIFNNLNNNQLNHKSIAIRIPKNKFCLSIIDKLNRPITSTSANLAGSPYPKSKTDINKKIIHGVDYFVETIDNDNLKPSKIIRIIDEKNYTVIRD